MNLALVKSLVNNPDTIHDNILAKAIALYACWKYKDTDVQALEEEALIAC